MTINDTAPTKAPTSTHGTLVSLLDQLKSLEVSNESQNDLNANFVDEKRLLKRVTLLHGALEELGFSDTSIQDILIHTAATSLEDCLDWACLHLGTQDLPAFLTDHDAVVDSMLTLQDPHRLTVVAAKKTSNETENETVSDSGGMKAEKELVAERLMAVESSVPPPVLLKEKQKPTDNDDDKAAQKAWLLAQYQYEEEDEEVSEDDDVVDISTMSPLEQELHNMETEYKEISTILEDETQQYMMNKHEIKEARKKNKMLKKQLDGLRRKVQQERARKQQEVVSAATEADNEEEEQGMAFDLFGDNNNHDDGGTDMFSTPSATKTTTATPTTNTAPVPNYSIPKNWTGKTPKQVLEERCKKLKCGPPKFNKRGTLNGGKITVKCKPPMEIQDEGPFQNWNDDGRNYLATRALYEMDSTLPLYRLLPPVFRDLWVSWLDAAKQEQQAEDQLLSDAKEQKMKEIVDAIMSRQPQRPAAAKSTVEAESQIETGEVNANDMEEHHVPDTWDDSESEEEPMKDVQHVRSEVSPEGAKLQSFFHKRQKAPQYQSMLEVRKALPMFSYRQQLLDTIQENQVTVLCAETGAGKTTQCGQFLLETALQGGFGDNISILCTQPRRVSAISVAERVSDEFGDKHVGDTIGYHIRLESKRSARTKLLFCTTGVVLRRLQDDPTLEGVTHVLVDEVHERQWQIDFLLIALRRLIHTTRKDLKIVLVSLLSLVCSY